MNHELPHGLKITAVWLLLGLTLFLGVKAWQHQQAQTRFSAAGGVIELRRGPDGHYHWPGTINGRPVEFLVDTGATATAISATLARELGLQSDGPVQSMTAAGAAVGEAVRADVALQGGVREALELLCAELARAARRTRSRSASASASDVVSQ